MSLNPFLHLKNGAVVKLQEIKSLTDHLLSTYFMVGLPFGVKHRQMENYNTGSKGNDKRRHGGWGRGGSRRRCLGRNENIQEDFLVEGQLVLSLKNE